jgi:hypothetical protein
MARLMGRHDFGPIILCRWIALDILEPLDVDEQIYNRKIPNHTSKRSTDTSLSHSSLSRSLASLVTRRHPSARPSPCSFHSRAPTSPRLAASPCRPPFGAPRANAGLTLTRCDGGGGADSSRGLQQRRRSRQRCRAGTGTLGRCAYSAGTARMCGRSAMPRPGYRHGGTTRHGHHAVPCRVVLGRPVWPCITGTAGTGRPSITAGGPVTVRCQTQTCAKKKVRHKN